MSKSTASQAIIPLIWYLASAFSILISTNLIFSYLPWIILHTCTLICWKRLAKENVLSVDSLMNYLNFEMGYSIGFLNYFSSTSVLERRETSRTQQTYTVSTWRSCGCKGWREGRAGDVGLDASTPHLLFPPWAHHAEQRILKKLNFIKKEASTEALKSTKSKAALGNA